MKLVTFVAPDGMARAGVLLGETVIDLAMAAPLVLEDATGLRWDMLSLLRGDQEEVNLDAAADLLVAIGQMVEGSGEPDPLGYGEEMALDLEGSLSIGGEAMLLPLSQVRVLAPLPRPSSLRIFEAFEEPVAASYTRRNQKLPGAWYRAPSFSFANHAAIYGPDDELPMPRSEALDYGLGLGCVIGREGRDIAPEDAPDFIAGYVILNTWSARDLEEAERALGLGPSKSRDFATSLGPWLLTPDELEQYADDEGRLSVTMRARVNGVERSRATAAGVYYPFAELVAHASRDATLRPGDVLGTGPVGGGTLAELTGGYGPWLERGDVVELEVTDLGLLRNTIGW